MAQSHTAPAQPDPTQTGSPRIQRTDIARKLDVARLSLVSNLILAVLKLAVGIMTGAIAILSDGINSACDLFATGLAYLALMKAGRPPDSDHPWGHGKIESLAGMIEALVIFAAGVYVVWHAIADLREHAQPEQGWLGVDVMIVSTVVNVFLSRRVLTIARETESIALRAEGQHIRTDVWTSGGVLATLLITRFASIPHLQSVAALCVSVLIFRAGYKVVIMALHPLIDTALPPDETLAIHQLLTSDPKVCGYHNLRTRRSGPTRMVDLHVMLPDDMTFVEAHQHAEMLEHSIELAFSGDTDVIIHAEPYMAEREHQEAHHPFSPLSLKPLP